MDASATQQQIHHPTTAELNSAIDRIIASPSAVGRVELVVRRPEVDQREVLDAAELRVGEGLVGDNYVARGDRHQPDGGPHPEAQLNLMNSRSLDACASGDRQRWALAGDQLIVDFDLSRQNLPTGTRLAVGTAVIEVTAKPHNGCAKFRARFGVDAARWVNSRDDLRLRGINAAVVEPGVVQPGDEIKKI
jgi:MOSC domain-containing protein YiiM